MTSNYAPKVETIFTNFENFSKITGQTIAEKAYLCFGAAKPLLWVIIRSAIQREVAKILIEQRNLLHRLDGSSELGVQLVDLLEAAIEHAAAERVTDLVVHGVAKNDGGVA